MSLSYYYEINPSTDILKCIEELLYKEDKCFNNILKNWKDIRRNHNDSFPNFWCYGAPGILLARKEIFDKTNIGNNDLSIIENVLTNVEKIRELNLCHDSVGTISCLDAILKDEENLLIKESIDFYFDNVVSQVIKPELSTDLNTMNTFSFQTSFLILFSLLCLYLISILARSMGILFSNIFFSRDIESFTFKHLLKLPYSFFELRAKGDILYRISSLSGFRELFTNQVVGGVVDIGTILSVVIYMFLSSKTLSIIALILSLINFLFLFSTRKIMYDTVNRELQEQSLIYSVETEALNTISSIKISGLEDEIYENWSKYLKNVLTKYKKRSIVHILYNSATNVFQLFAPIIILIFGLDNVLNGKILLGEVVAFQTMASILFSSEISIFNAYTQYILAAGYLNRVNDIWLENEENVENGLKKCSLEGRIDIKDLSFSYSKDSAPVIENLNLTIEPGQRIALVGQSGSGKSTLSKILSGLYKIDTGKVLFDGVNINQIDKKILSQNLGVVPQDSFLLNRSILDNITLKNEVTSQKIEEVCKAVQIYDEIMAMPMKFNTIISEMGSNISGGQRQRIALARALINNPSIVILDEATSALDTINEERITKYIQSQGCTQIIIAHRLSTIKDADIIFVMKGGKIVESGNHKYLMDLGGEYYSLYTKRK
ncbi:lantibiotic export protein [Streptococcus pneumoniae]|nr:lantibiotic export protein [Streptococcus pneumoniae]